MKVLYIAKSQVSAAYQGLPQELSRLGVELTVVVPPRWGSQRLENEEVSGYTMRVLPCVMSGKNHFHFYTRLLEDEGFDLIHLDEEPWSLVTRQWVRRAKIWGKPLIFFTWQNIEKRYPFPFALWERDTFAYASAAIAGSREAEAVLRRKGFTGPVTVFPEVGVDADVFSRRESSTLRRQLKMEGKFVIGFAGRMIQEKGLLDLVRAFALLPEDCALVMIGCGDRKAEAEVLGRQLGIFDRTRWVPSVPSLEMPAYMSLMDVLVLPSHTSARWKEQFGRVLVEAMSCGTVPVGSSSAEIPNVIGEAGLIFPEGDVQGLASSLRTLREDAGLRKQLAAAGRERVIRQFTHRRIAEQTVDLYGRTLRPRAVAIPGGELVQQ